MNWITSFLTSSIGRKLVMALTGLFLISFLFVHLIGNLLLFKDDGGEAFNVYSQFMTTAGIIRVAEIVLVTGFVLHIYTSIVLFRRNKSARTVSYEQGNKTPGVSWFSKNMNLTGIVILLFLSLHLRTFWYRYHYEQVPMVAYEKTPSPDGRISEVRVVEVTPENRDQFSSLEVYKDMTGITWEAFRNPYLVGFYALSMIFLGMHLAHGFTSAFRTLGLEHRKYTPLIKAIGKGIAVLVPVGFVSIAVYIWVKSPEMPTAEPSTQIGLETSVQAAPTR